MYCVAIVSEGRRMAPRVVTTNALLRFLDDENSSRPTQSSRDESTGENRLTFIAPVLNAVFAKEFATPEEGQVLAKALLALSIEDLCTWVETRNPDWTPLPEFETWK